MKRYKRLQWIMLGAVFSLLLTGCFGSNEMSQSIDPPPTMAEGEWRWFEDAEVRNEETIQVTLYFEDADGFVAPVSMRLPQEIGIAKQSLQYMVEDGPVQSMLPQGFRALLPKGTEVLGIDVIEDKKLAVVDFSEHFTSYNVQDERKMLEAITWMLTGFPAIEQIQIWVEGKLLKEMPVAGTPIDEPLSRKMGINLERASGVSLSQAMPVTLYFLNQGQDYTYYVPVTRLISQNSNVAMSAMEELILGPTKNTSLASVILPDAQVLNIQQTEQLITVNLSEDVVGIEDKVPAETLQSVMLTLIETTGIPQVQFMVNGSAQVEGTDHFNYSQPVSRPHHLNPVEM